MARFKAHKSFLLPAAFFLFGQMAFGQLEMKEKLSLLNKELQSAYAAKDLDRSLKIAQQIASASEVVYGTEGFDTGVAYENVGIIQQMQKKYSESVVSLNKAVLGFGDSERRSKLKKLSILSRIGLVHFLDGNKKEEESALKVSLEFASKSFGAKDRESLAPTLDLARFYSRSKNLNYANNLYLDAYEIAVQNFGPSAKEIVMIDEAVICSDIMFDNVRDPDEPGFWADRRLITKGRNENFANLNKLVISVFKSAYPSNTLLGDRGKVAVKISLDEKGQVVQAKSICEVTKFLGEVAEESAKKSKFRPYTINGKPVLAWGFMVYNFN